MNKGTPFPGSKMRAKDWVLGGGEELEKDCVLRKMMNRESVRDLQHELILKAIFEVDCLGLFFFKNSHSNKVDRFS